MTFFLHSRKGAGVGRVFPFATIANQPHILENRYTPGSGVGASTIANRRALSRRATVKKNIATPGINALIYSKNNITDGGFTIGYEVNKDMDNTEYDNEFDPNDFPNFFPNMQAFTDENIVLGDKNEEDRLIASYWDDLGDDVFDDWGYFYLYDVNSGKYYFPILNSQNGDDGEFYTQTFNAFGRTFTIKHGWAVYGIFKFDISVADNLPFRFGAYGNMGSDGDEFTQSLVYNYSIGEQNLKLHYHRDQEEGDYEEQLYSYWIPKNTLENSSQTYDIFYDDDDMSILSKPITTGLLVYFAKSNDVKDWVINDLSIA